MICTPDRRLLHSLNAISKFIFRGYGIRTNCNISGARALPGFVEGPVSYLENETFDGASLYKNAENLFKKVH